MKQLDFSGIDVVRTAEREMRHDAFWGPLNETRRTAARVACDFFAFVGEVDAVMITARHGGLHLPFALPYIREGAKLWIDKPITASVEDARELVRLAHEKHLLLCGGSSLAGAEGTVLRSCAPQAQV